MNKTKKLNNIKLSDKSELPQPLRYECPDDWRDEARRRFGDEPLLWRFVCPSCGHVASVAEWKHVGATEGEIAFSCIGRHIKGSNQMCVKPGPCNYAGGGLIGLNPIEIITGPGQSTRVFKFANPK